MSTDDSITSDSVISVRNVWKSFRVYHQRAHTLKETLLVRRSAYDEFWALKDISFEVGKGEMLGVIGPNGSGKSTLLKCLARILTPNAGAIEVRGTQSSLLELGTGFHPELSGKENIYLAGSILGLHRDEIDNEYESIVDFAGVGDFIDTPVKNYSSGMLARLAFSVAISVDPEILLVDEVLAVGDEAFQLKCYERITDLRSQGKTVVFVSHSLDAIRRLCSSVLWIEKGIVIAHGRAEEVVGEYLEKVQAEDAHAHHAWHDDGLGRPGTHTIRLTDFETLDGDDDPNGRLRTGDPATLRIHYECDEPADPVVVTIKINRVDDGMCIAGFNSLTTPLKQPLALEAGSGHIDYAIASLPLWHGNFSVTIAAGDELGTVIYDRRNDAFSFAVVAGNFPAGDGLVLIDGEWRHTANGK